MADSSEHWAARGSPARILCSVILLLFCVITPFVLLKYILLPQRDPNDYFAFRSFASFVRVHPPALIYDVDVLNQFQLQIHGKFFPYLYHPGMLLLVWPIACLPYVLGWVVWIGVGLLAYIVAVDGPKGNVAVVLAALVAPSTLWVVMCGQSTLLAAALLFGGFRLLPRQPVLAGLLFGLLFYKPQFGVLVPVALVAAGQWRAILSAFVTVMLVVLTSAAAFGWSIWATWLHHLPSIGNIISTNLLALNALMATVTSNLVTLGLTPGHAHLVQMASSLGAAIVVWCCFRRNTGMLGAVVVAVSTFLTTPYAFGYDMPILTAAVIVFINERWQRDDAFSFPEILVLTASFLLPYCVISVVFFRFSSLVILALLWVVVRRIWTARAEVTVSQLSFTTAMA
jgi:hypothetical protein